MASAKELLDRLTIREIVENWALLRDARRWDRFRELWHEEGRMITSGSRAASKTSSRRAKLATTEAFASCISSAAPRSTLSAIVPSLKRSK